MADRPSSAPDGVGALDALGVDQPGAGLGVAAFLQPTLHGALLAARIAGHSHVIVDGTLIHTDRNRTPGPTAAVDLWWSGKHHHHGGNIQVVSAPDGWPLWTSGVRPGREHDTTAARADPDLLTQVEPDIFTVPFKKPKGQKLTIDQQTYNAVHGALRCLGERANSLLKTTYKTLRHYRGCP